MQTLWPSEIPSHTHTHMSSAAQNLSRRSSAPVLYQRHAPAGTHCLNRDSTFLGADVDEQQNPFQSATPTSIRAPVFEPQRNQKEKKKNMHTVPNGLLDLEEKGTATEKVAHRCR